MLLICAFLPDFEVVLLTAVQERKGGRRERERERERVRVRERERE